MAVTRELEITYGAYEVPNIDGKYRIDRDRERASLTFSFLIQADTAEAFAAAAVVAEAAFSKPYQALLVVINDDGGDPKTLISASQAASTGLDPLPSISKEEHVADSGRSRRYTATVEYGLPATTGAEPDTGLRDSSVDVSYSPERRRRVTISGTYTANGGSSARDVYDAGIDNYADSILTDLSLASANREIADEPSVRHDTNNKLCEFTRVYSELVFSQGGSTLNDAGIVDQRLTITRRQEGPGDTPTSERLATLDLTYEAGIDKDVTTGLVAKYASIRDWLLTQVTTVLDGGQFAVTMEEPIYDYDTNRLSARWTVIGQPTGEIVLENRITTDDDDEIGTAFVPIWGGNPTDAYTWDGPRIPIRTITHTQRRIGTFGVQNAVNLLQGGVAAARSDGTPPDAPGNGAWRLIQRRPSATRLRLGIGQDTMDVTDLALTTRMRYVTAPVSSEPGGGGVITP